MEGLSQMIGWEGWVFGTSQEIGWEDRLRNECVERDVKTCSS